ncbi:MAG TPA: universal stress protein [Candidatus Polarisedimenticolia bacterium]|nr:universal stress protein [Candidatus Polarisedimenticolia bacterium]
MRRKGTGKHEGNSDRPSILAGVDFSDASRKALDQALSLAREREAHLLILHVIDGEGLRETAPLAGVSEEVLQERLEKERRQRVEEVVAEARGRNGDAPCQVRIAWGRPFQEILRSGRENAVNLIVLGTAGRSADLERALFGSTAEKVLRAAPCPVLCVPAD